MCHLRITYSFVLAFSIYSYVYFQRLGYLNVFLAILRLFSCFFLTVECELPLNRAHGLVRVRAPAGRVETRALIGETDD